MTRKWVSNASPVILLAKVDQVNLLPRLADVLVIPNAVAEEIRGGPADDPAKRWLQDAGQAFIRSSERVPSEVAAWDLGRGEAAVLSWAHARKGWTAVLDDGAARRAARAFGLPATGTLGVVLAAKKAGKVNQVRPVLEALVQAGLRVSDSLLERALRYAGELE